MLSSILFFLLGVIVANIFRSQPRADMLLYWSRECLGWRPVSPGTKIDPSIRYMAAFEVEPALAQHDVDK